jgi:hypothetical protein
MIDFDIYVYEKRLRLVIADSPERKRWSSIGVRRLVRDSKLSQTPVSNAIKGKPAPPGRPGEHQTDRSLDPDPAIIRRLLCEPTDPPLTAILLGVIGNEHVFGAKL